MSDFADILDANRGYVDAFDRAGAAKIPARNLIVLTCMDARVDPLRALGLDLGEAHVLRNAGGRVSEDVVRSIAISATALQTSRVAVIHHTDCGMLTDDESALRDQLVANGLDVGDDTPLLTFSDEEASVREDVDALRADGMVPDDLTIAGYLYDVATGEVRPVD